MTFDISTLRRDYGDIAGEVAACRNAVALFDFSFVARACVRGSGGAALIARLTPRPLADLAPGRIRYAAHVDRAGRLLSDVTVWRLNEETWEVMSGRAADIAALAAMAAPHATVEDLTTETAILALQGPRTLAALADLADCDRIAALPYFGHAEIAVGGHPARVGRLGYTGEPGVEIIVAKTAAADLWRRLSERARPAGFAAADTLRIEAGFILFANELQVPVSAAEAGLHLFAGSGHTAARVLTLVALACEDRDIARPWQPPSPPPRPAAHGAVAITSACRSALADGLLLLGFVRMEDLAARVPMHDSAGQFQALRRVPLPLFDPGKRRPRVPMPR